MNTSFTTWLESRVKSFGNMDKFSDSRAEDPRWETEAEDGYGPDSWLTKGNNSQRPSDMRKPGEWQAGNSSDMKTMDAIMRVGKELLDQQNHKWELMKQTHDNKNAIETLTKNVMSLVRGYPNQSEAMTKLRELGIFDHDNPNPGTSQNAFWGKMKNRM